MASPFHFLEVPICARDRLVASLSLYLLLVLLVLVSWYLCLSGSYFYCVLLSCLIAVPSFSLSRPWGVPRCCLGSLQSWNSLHRLPWRTLLSPSFAAQALREWRRAEKFCTFHPFVRVRVCATHSILCIVYCPWAMCLYLHRCAVLSYLPSVLGLLDVVGGPG